MMNDLTFCQMPLDRASNLRKNSVWLQEQLISQDSHYYFFWRGMFVFLEQEVFTFTQQVAVGADKSNSNVAVFTLLLGESSAVFLGAQKTKAHFVCDLSYMDKATIEQWLAKFSFDKLTLIEFRRSISLLSHQQAAILSYAKALVHWQQSALYCGHCGSKTEALDGGHRRLCLNDACQKEHFPRTDPAVIMLVEFQPKSGPAVCLLAEHHRTPEQVFSTLAGFVDPGESLEEAVTREVFEEAGIEVANVCYIDSQPWPFPNSLMIGFIAQAQNTNISIEQEELRSAHWFTAEQLADFNDWGDEVDGPKLPRKESIARLLIDSWCEKQFAITATEAVNSI